MINLDKAVENIEQGDAWDESDEVVRVEVKKPLDKVIPIRLSTDKWKELRRKSKRTGHRPHHTCPHVDSGAFAPAGKGLNLRVVLGIYSDVVIRKITGPNYCLTLPSV